MFRRLFQSLCRSEPSRHDSVRLKYRPRVQSLEDRLVLSTYSAVPNFSIVSNPHAPWSWLSETSSTTQLLTTKVDDFDGVEGVDGWNNGQAEPNFADVARNATKSTQTFGTVQLPTNLLGMDPESNTAVITRWTAPYAETWSITGLFQGIDTGENAHDVEILRNGSTQLLAPTSVSSFGQQVPFNVTLNLAKGDTIDFVVDTGATWTNLSTGLSATIQTAGVVTHLGVAGPSTATAGTPFSVTVSALDAYNGVVPNYVGTVHFTSSDQHANLPGNYTFTTADKGKHVFTNEVTLNSTGTQTVVATDTTTNTITGTHKVKVQPHVLATSTFDSDLDGWTSNTPSQVTWSATGGNPGGFMLFTDQTGASTVVDAPSKFLGDWSALNGVGTFSFDDKIIAETSIQSVSPYEVDLSGPGGAAYWTGATATGTTGWVRVTVPLTGQTVDGWHLTSGTWAGLLANITQVQIPIELVTNSGSAGTYTDQEGIDNVTLAGPSAPVGPVTASVVDGTGRMTDIRKVPGSSVGGDFIVGPATANRQVDEMFAALVRHDRDPIASVGRWTIPADASRAAHDALQGFADMWIDAATSWNALEEARA